MIGDLINGKFGFNKIYILDSPRVGESKSGKELYNWLKNKLLFNEIKCERIEIVSKKSLIKTLHQIAQNTAQKKSYPLIHFEMHGNELGIETRPGELLNWEQLLNLTRQINMLTHNNLVLSFAVCNAGFMYAQVEIFKRAAFFGFVGSIEKVDFGPMEVGYNSFFDILLNTNNVNAAMDHMNKNYIYEYEELNSSKLDHSKFEFYLAEKFFEDVWAMYDKDSDDKNIFNERIRNQMILALKNPSTKYKYSLPQLRYELEQVNSFEQRALMKQQMKDYFLINQV